MKLSSDVQLILDNVDAIQSAANTAVPIWTDREYQILQIKIELAKVHAIAVLINRVEWVNDAIRGEKAS